MKWLMNPDNNPTMLAIALAVCAACVLISFAASAP